MINLERKIELAKHFPKSERNEVCLEKEENEYIDKCLTVLQKTSENNFDLSDEEKEIFILFSNIQRIKDGDIKRFLFRYSSYERAKESIEEKQIRMSSVKEFNDPFEGILHADYENASEIEIFRYFYEPIKFNNNALFKLKKDLENVEKRKEYAGIIRENHKRNVESSGIFCCSGINDSIPMWSHYARSHSGICLEYDILKDSELFDFVNTVDYTEKFPASVSWDQAQKDFLKISLMTKAVLWRNEEELRLIKLESAGKKVDINPDCLKSVIFGLKCEKEFRNELIKIMREKGYNKNTEIKEAVKAENAYKLEIKPIGVLSEPLEELTR